MVEDSNTIKYALGAASALVMGYFAYRSMQTSAPVEEKKTEETSAPAKEGALTYD